MMKRCYFLILFLIATFIFCSINNSFVLDLQAASPSLDHLKTTNQKVDPTPVASSETLAIAYNVPIDAVEYIKSISLIQNTSENDTINNPPRINSTLLEARLKDYSQGKTKNLLLDVYRYLKEKHTDKVISLQTAEKLFDMGYDLTEIHKAEILSYFTQVSAEQILIQSGDSKYQKSWKQISNNLKINYAIVAPLLDEK